MIHKLYSQTDYANEIQRIWLFVTLIAAKWAAGQYLLFIWCEACIVLIISRDIVASLWEDELVDAHRNPLSHLWVEDWKNGS